MITIRCSFQYALSPKLISTVKPTMNAVVTQKACHGTEIQLPEVNAQCAPVCAA